MPDNNTSPGFSEGSPYPIQEIPIVATNPANYAQGNMTMGGISSAFDFGQSIQSAANNSFNSSLPGRLVQYLKDEARTKKARQQAREDALWAAQVQRDINESLAIGAEQRANSEWQRRFDATNEYNEGWADRLRKQAINPLSYVTKGQAGAMAASSPSTPQSSPSISPLQAVSSIALEQAVANIRKTNAEINDINARAASTRASTVGQNLSNQTYMEKFEKEIEQIAATVRNTNAQARINESAANVAEATEQWNIESAQFHCEQLALDLRRGGVEVEIAQVALQQARDNLLRSALERQLIGQQIVLNGQEISLNELTFDQFLLGLNEMKATSDARTRSAIATFEAEAKKATVEANWAGINQFTSNFSSLANSISNVVSAVKPGISLSTSTSEQTIDKYDRKGNFAGSTVIKNSNSQHSTRR